LHYAHYRAQADDVSRSMSPSPSPFRADGIVLVDPPDSTASIPNIRGRL